MGIEEEIDDDDEGKVGEMVRVDGVPGGECEGADEREGGVWQLPEGSSRFATE